MAKPGSEGDQGFSDLIHHLEGHFGVVNQRLKRIEHVLVTLAGEVQGNPALEKLTQQLAGPTEELRIAVEKNKLGE